MEKLNKKYIYYIKQNIQFFLIARKENKETKKQSKYKVQSKRVEMNRSKSIISISTQINLNRLN